MGSTWTIKVERDARDASGPPREERVSELDLPFGGRASVLRDADGTWSWFLFDAQDNLIGADVGLASEDVAKTTVVALVFGVRNRGLALLAVVALVVLLAGVAIALIP